MSAITPEDRARLRDLAGRATPGPWEMDLDGDLQGRRPGMSPDPEMDPMVGVLERDEDTAFIAAADPSTVTALLDALDAAEFERDRALVTGAQHALRCLPRGTSRDSLRADRAEAAVQRVRDQAQGWRDEYSDPVYRDNGWCQGVVSAARAILETLDGDA